MIEALGVPSFQAPVQPAVPTRAFPALPLAGRWHFGGPINRLTHVLSQQFAWHAFRPALNRWRSSMDIGH